MVLQRENYTIEMTCEVVDSTIVAYHPQVFVKRDTIDPRVHIEIQKTSL